MSTQIQRRRGTTAQHASFTGAVGETTIDTDKEVVVVHDGVQVGGYPLMRENGSNSALALGSAATPSLKFTGDTNTGIYSPGADQVAISTGGSGRLFVDASGRVGVGATSAAANFEVSQSGTASASDVLRIYNRTDGTSTGYLGLPKYGSTASAYGPYSANNVGINAVFTQLNIGTETAHALAAYTNNTERLRITSTGALNFVGAGTAGSTQAVSFNGSAPVNSLVIDSSGRLGVGTSSPATTLDVNGTITCGTPGGVALSIAGGSAIRNLSAAASRMYFDTSFGSATHGSFEFRSSNAGTSRLVIDTSGNVGIGTTSPTGQLSLQETTAPTIDFYTGATKRGIIKATAAVLDLNPLTGSDITFTCDSTERMRLTTAGRLGIGTTSPQFDCTVSKQGTGVTSYIGIRAGENGSASTSNAAVLYYRIRGGGPGDVDANITYSYNGAYLLQSSSQDGYTWSTSAGEAVRIDSSRRLLVGTSSARNNFYNGANTNQVQIEGTTYQNSGLALTCNNSYFDDTAVLCFNKSATTSIGSNTLVGSTHKLGAVTFQGNDGTEFVEAAKIEAFVDGTPGANDMPGRLVFSTTADGASSPTERMRIGNDGTTLWRSVGTASYHDLGNNNTSFAGDVIAFSAYRNTSNSTYNFLTCVRQGFANALHIRDSGNVVNVNNSYGAISDAKLKENIVDAGSQWNDLKSLQIRKYNFKEETGQPTHTQIGLIAQEAELVSPGLVNESPDRDNEGNDLGTVTKSVNYSVLYMKAVKALQEAMKRIEVLEQRLADAGIA